MIINTKGTTPWNNAPVVDIEGAACRKGIKDIFIPSIFEFSSYNTSSNILALITIIF